MPWLNDRTIRLINKKHKLFIALKRKLISYAFFKAYARDLAYLVHRIKCKYIRNRFSTCNEDSKKTWQTINMVYNRKNKRHVKTIKLNDNTVTNDENTIMEEFMNFFRDKPLNIHAGIGKSIVNYDYLIPYNEDSMCLNMTNSEEIKRIIIGLKNKGGDILLPVKF